VISGSALEKLTLILVEGLVELVDGGRNLQALLENCSLALQANVSGPFDNAAEVALEHDILSNTEVLGILGEQVPVLALPVLGNLLAVAPAGFGCWSHLFAFALMGEGTGGTILQQGQCEEGIEAIRTHICW